MNVPIRSVLMRADDVCAYLWSRQSVDDRQELTCATGLSDSVALLDWYELGHAERIPLMSAMVREIEARASLQRQQRRQAESAI